MCQSLTEGQQVKGQSHTKLTMTDERKVFSLADVNIVLSQ